MRSDARGWWGVVALAVVGWGMLSCATATGGVAGSSASVTIGAWQEPRYYEYTMDSACGERALIGRFRLWVAAAEVFRADGLDEPGRRLVAMARPATFPTLRDLLDEYDAARRQGADSATVAFDPDDGHPTRIELDPLANAIDDESCYVISGYTVLPGPHSPS